MRTSRWRWHLDEVFVRINAVQHYLWRAVDHEGEVLEAFVSKHRDKKAALKFLRKLMKRHGRAEELVTDGLRSYSAALKEIGAQERQITGPGRTTGSRIHTSHYEGGAGDAPLPAHASLQTFAAVHSSVCNHFNSDRSLSSRNTYKLNRAAALAEWRALCAA